jgi:archaeoflavoprotein AfpA
LKERPIRRKLAWGITGSGDKIRETFNVMRCLNEKHKDIEVEVFLSRAGELVTKFYKLDEELKEAFSKVFVEKNANSPFLAARLQLGEFDFFLIAPATSNTVAKFAHGVADTLITNSILQALKAYVPVYIMPVDYREGTTVTKLPDGRELKLRVRKEDATNVQRIANMEDVYTFEKPEEIIDIFRIFYESS